jgi:hypothetical protein
MQVGDVAADALRSEKQKEVPKEERRRPVERPRSPKRSAAAVAIAAKSGVNAGGRQIVLDFAHLAETLNLGRVRP